MAGASASKDNTMAEPQESLSMPVDPLQLDRCPDCGCLLAGRPAESTCPKCGCAFSPAMVVLYGWAPGMTLNAAGTRGWAAFWCLVLLSSTMAMDGCRHLLHGNRRSGLLSFGLVGVSIVLTLYQRWNARRETGAPLQLRLTHQGVAQRIGRGAVTPVPWKSIRQMSIHRFGERSYEVQARGGSWLRRLHHGHPADFQFDIDPPDITRLMARLREWYPAVKLWDDRDARLVHGTSDSGSGPAAA